MKSDRHARDRYFLIGIIGGSGVLHFLVPRFYRPTVPRVLGHAQEIVLISGAAEIACAAMLVAPPTRRAGGWLTAALLVAVWPANLQQAIDGRPYARQGPLSSRALPWLRLPLQVPMIRMALRTARET